MPYVPTAQKAREKWITGKEALTHIQTVEKCDAGSAWQQLQPALAEGAVLASWPMSEPTLQGAGERTHRPIVSEAEREDFWRSVRINLSEGTVVQQEAALQYEDGRYVDDPDDDDDDDLLPVEKVLRDVEREFWVLKESIFKFWNTQAAEAETAQARTDLEPKPSFLEYLSSGASCPRKGPKPKADDNQIAQGIRELVKELEERGWLHQDVHVLRALLQMKLDMRVGKKDFDRIYKKEFRELTRACPQLG